MNSPDSHEHAFAWPLLPWHAAGRLDGADEAVVTAHVRGCAACQAELAWQRQLHGAAAAADEAAPIPDAEGALARLLPRLDEPAGAASRVHAPRRPAALAALLAWLRRPPLLPAAFAMAVLAVAVALTPERDAGYRGLGPVPDNAGDTTVVFRPDTGADEVRRILAAAGAGAVHGPTVAGAYVLAIGPAGQAAALQRLRAEPAVLMAEPLGNGEPR